MTDAKSDNYYPQGNRVGKPDEPMDAATSDGSVFSRIIRCMGSRKPNKATWSKHPTDAHILYGIPQWGIAHFVRGSADDVHDALVDLYPEEWSGVPFETPRNGNTLAAWEATAGTPAGIQAQLDYWRGKYLSRALESWERLNWRSARGLAILARWCNSRPADIAPGGRGYELAKQVTADAGELEAVERVLDAYKGTNHRRAQTIRAWFPAEETVGRSQVDAPDHAAASAEPVSGAGSSLIVLGLIITGGLLLWT